jgi:hypothetical protein
VLAKERAWLPLQARPARTIRWVAWLAILGCALHFALAGLSGADLGLLLGGGTWQSAVVAVLQGLLVVFASLWVIDLFQRRHDRRTAAAAVLSRAAYAAFLVHQGVLVLAVLASHRVGWAPEVSYAAVTVTGVVVSFAVGLVLTRAPLLRRIL